MRWLITTLVVLGSIATRGAMSFAQNAEGNQAQAPENQAQVAGRQAQAQGQVQGQAQEQEGSVPIRPTAALSRLHKAAMREIQLGEMAKGGGAHRDTRRYGATLVADFRAFDRRLIAYAAENGVAEDQLNNVYRGENVVALSRQVDDLGRLSNEGGEQFDRDFWVAIAHEQAATSDLLPSVMVRQPTLSTQASDFGQLLDHSSRRALELAKATEHEAPTPATNPTLPSLSPLSPLSP